LAKPNSSLSRLGSRRNRGLLPRLAMALAAVGLFILAYQWGNQVRYGGGWGGGPPAVGGVLLRPPQALPDFVLHDSAGEPFGRPDLFAHWNLLAIASLSGADGHRGLTRLVEVYNRLAARRALRQRLRLLLVSADAAPALARDFERLSPAIAVLIGDRDAVAELRSALGATPERVDNAAEPPTLFVLSPDAELIALFPSAQPAAEIAEDIRALDRYYAHRPE
jgi:hypothetical protein